MLHCKVKINDKGTPPAVIDALKPDYKTGELDTAVILEGGMSSGRPSITLHIVTEEGKSVIVQTSVTILDMIQSCIRGAEQRWAERNAGKN